MKIMHPILTYKLLNIDQKYIQLADPAEKSKIWEEKKSKILTAFLFIGKPSSPHI